MVPPLLDLDRHAWHAPGGPLRTVARPSGGHGKALLAFLAAVCQQNGYERFEWWVLAWNEPTIDFYKSLGVELLDEWTVCRLSGEPLKELAAQAPAVLDQPPAL